MATWAEILTDSKTYADEVKVSVNGTDMTVGDLRKQAGLKAEFTKHTQELTGRASKAEQALQQREAQLQQMQAQLGVLMQQRGGNASNAQDDDLSVYRSDPAFGPLVKLIEQQKGHIEQLANRVQMDEVAVRSMRYQDDLNRLKSQNQDLDPDALVKFTTDLYSKGPNLDHAYKLMTFDEQIKKREAEAEQRGYEKAKKEPPAPPMPFGGRKKAAASTLELPKNLNDRVAMAASDPDILALAEGEA